MEFKTAAAPLDMENQYHPYSAYRRRETYAVRSGTSHSRSPPSPSAHNPDRQTLNQILDTGALAVPTHDPATAAFYDRREAGWLGLDDAIYQVRQRYAIYTHNFYELELAKCAATNALHAWEAERGQPSDRQLDNLQSLLQNLYLQQRQERVSLWRDVSRLRQAVPAWAQQYTSAVRKAELLAPTRGDR